MIEVVATATSTQELARAAAVAGVPSGAAFRARAQTDGRGRRGRVWAMPPDSGVAMTLVLRPKMEIGRVGWVPLAAAVGVRDVLGARFGIKWPNDVQGPDGRKVAGVLCEADVVGGRLNYVLVGIGLNVTQAPPLATAACVREWGDDRSVDELAEALYAAVRARIDALPGGEARLREDWLAGCNHLGFVVRVGDVSGLSVGLADDGGLVLSTSRGDQSVHAGEVELLAVDGPGMRVRN